MSSPIDQIRTAILDLHQALIAVARQDYERVHGQVSPAKLLELLIQDPEFRWLHPFSRFIVSVDEQLEAPELTSADLNRLTGELEGLLSLPRYLEVLQSVPEVVVAHGMLKDALDSSGLNVREVGAIDPSLAFPPDVTMN